MPNEEKPDVMGSEGQSEQGSRVVGQVKDVAPVKAAEPPAPTDTREEAPQTVPYQQFSRVYAQGKESDRKAAYWEAVAKGQIQVPGVPKPSAGQNPAPATAPDDDTQFVQKAVKPLLDPVMQELNESRRERMLSGAERQLNSFWQQNPDHAAYRADLDKLYLEGVQAGQNVDPTLLLDVLIGRSQRAEKEARRAAAEGTTRRVTEANKVAATTTGDRAISTSGREKAPEEMTTAEMEAEFGDVVFWQKGQRQ